MIRILTILGARPQFIKAAAINRELRENYKGIVEETILHTGQHYDSNMSEIFFQELEIDKPKYNLGVGSGTHSFHTSWMMKGIQETIFKEQPSLVLVYGDTNSTLAGSLTASKMEIPVVHVEAGLRSFNKKMPEEVNRVLTDHVSTLLFAPTKAAILNLKSEGLEVSEGPFSLNNPGVFHCGDIMYDNSLFFSQDRIDEEDILKKYYLKDEDFILASVHRPHNTDSAERLKSILKALKQIADEHDLSVILPMHPRTQEAIDVLPKNFMTTLRFNQRFKLTPPVSYIEMITLQKNAKIVITDSGGMQKEAYFFKKPCLVLRKETEWVELVENGNSKLVDANKEAILKGANYFLGNPEISYPNIFGDGKSASFICKQIADHFKN